MREYRSAASEPPIVVTHAFVRGRMRLAYRVLGFTMIVFGALFALTGTTPLGGLFAVLLGFLLLWGIAQYAMVTIDRGAGTIEIRRVRRPMRDDVVQLRRERVQRVEIVRTMWRSAAMCELKFVLDGDERVPILPGKTGDQPNVLRVAAELRAALELDDA